MRHRSTTETKAMEGRRPPRQSCQRAAQRCGVRTRLVLSDVNAVSSVLLLWPLVSMRNEFEASDVTRASRRTATRIVSRWWVLLKMLRVTPPGWERAKKADDGGVGCSSDSAAGAIASDEIDGVAAGRNPRVMDGIYPRHLVKLPFVKSYIGPFYEMTCG